MTFSSSNVGCPESCAESCAIRDSVNVPEIKIGCVANLWARQMYFRNAGDVEQGHTHQFDHLTLLAAGSLKVTVEGIATEFHAPNMIYIHKDKMHELVALQDDTVAYCIHALRDGDRVEDIIDPASVPAGIDPWEITKTYNIESK